MTLERAEEAAYGAIEPLVVAADRLDLSPDHVTVMSLVAAFIAGALLTHASTATYIAAVPVVALIGVFDVVDGELARRQESESRRGDYLDHSADRYGDAAVLVGAAAGVEAWIPGFFAVSGVLLTAYMGTQAQAVGVGRIYSGLLARADILAITALASLLAALQLGTAGLHPIELTLILFAVLGHLTALQRFALTIRDLER